MIKPTFEAGLFCLYVHVLLHPTHRIFPEFSERGIGTIPNEDFQPSHALMMRPTGLYLCIVGHLSGICDDVFPVFEPTVPSGNHNNICLDQDFTKINFFKFGSPKKLI